MDLKLYPIRLSGIDIREVPTTIIESPNVSVYNTTQFEHR
jgi:hypothetical protein